MTKHLITAIGQETYVTLPKGQLIPTTEAHIAQGGAKPLVPGGGHVLVSPPRNARLTQDHPHCPSPDPPLDPRRRRDEHHFRD